MEIAEEGDLADPRKAGSAPARRVFSLSGIALKYFRLVCGTASLISPYPLGDEVGENECQRYAC